MTRLLASLRSHVSTPLGSTYGVRIAFTYAALNNIDVFAADIQIAYLQAPSSQKHYVICGVEFGLDVGGKSAGVIFEITCENFSDLHPVLQIIILCRLVVE